MVSELTAVVPPPPVQLSVPPWLLGEYCVPSVVKFVLAPLLAAASVVALDSL